MTIARGLTALTRAEDLSLCLGYDVALGDDDDVSRLEERSDLFRRVDSREVVDDADSGDFLKIRGATIAKPCGFGDKKIKSLAVSQFTTSSMFEAKKWSGQRPPESPFDGDSCFLVQDVIISEQTVKFYNADLLSICLKGGDRL